MKAPTPTNNLDFNEPRSISRAAPPPAASEYRFGPWLARGVAGLIAWPRHQAVMHELEVMTDRELADIGLTRGAIPHVFDAPTSGA